MSIVWVCVPFVYCVLKCYICIDVSPLDKQFAFFVSQILSDSADMSWIFNVKSWIYSDLLHSKFNDSFFATLLTRLLCQSSNIFITHFVLYLVFLGMVSCSHDLFLYTFRISKTWISHLEGQFNSWRLTMKEAFISRVLIPWAIL